MTDILDYIFTGTLSPDFDPAQTGIRAFDYLFTVCRMPVEYMGFPEIRGTHWGSYNKERKILGSILGSPLLGNYHIISRLLLGN